MIPGSTRFFISSKAIVLCPTHCRKAGNTQRSTLHAKPLSDSYFQDKVTGKDTLGSENVRSHLENAGEEGKFGLVLDWGNRNPVEIRGQRLQADWEYITMACTHSHTLVTALVYFPPSILTLFFHISCWKTSFSVLLVLLLCFHGNLRQGLIWFITSRNLSYFILPGGCIWE